MNRESRRNLIKEGVSKETAEKLNLFNQPCTLTEAVQISRGVAEDVLTDFQRKTAPMHVSVSLQLELVKKILIDSGLVTEEQFHDMYVEKAEEFDKMQKEALGETEDSDSPKMEIKINDIDIQADRR